MKRRILVLLVALVMMASMAVPAFAAEERGSTIIGLEVSLYAARDHSFLVIENTCAYTFTVGDYTVGAFETVTVGAYPDYSYVFVNRELGDMDDYSELHAVTASFYIGELFDIVDTINEHYDTFGTYNGMTNNCVHFAMNLWNAIVPQSGKINFDFTYDNNLSVDENTDINYRRFVQVLSSLTGYYVSNPELF